MVTIIVEKTVNAPISAVWDSWDDYANIDGFHPGVQKSYLLGDSADTGIGALRQCDFTDGKTFLKEEIVGYEKNKMMAINIIGTNAPIKDASATFDFQALGSNQTKVVMTMAFTPKFGLLGRLMVPLMKRQFRKGLAGLLDGNAEHVEQREPLRAVA